MSIFGFITGLFMEDVQTMEDMQIMDDMQTLEDMRHMNDPYENPGMDLVVDESYHGIDHGMGIANPEHNFEHMDDGLFGSSDDSFFGGSDDSFFGGGGGGGDFF